MNVPTKLILSLSAGWCALSGLAALFLPEEIAAASGAAASPHFTLVVQLCAAMLLGFAMLDWMSRGNLVGGIYARPLVVANFVHFAVGAITMLEMIYTGTASTEVAAICAGYVALAAAFAVLLFRSPVQ